MLAERARLAARVRVRLEPMVILLNLNKSSASRGGGAQLSEQMAAVAGLLIGQTVEQVDLVAKRRAKQLAAVAGHRQ